MMKYLLGLGALGVVVIGYFVLVPAGPPTIPAPAPDAPAPDPAPVVAPDPVLPDEAAPVTASDEALLEEMAADVRENLPEDVTETLTLTDAVFLPRMRIMEFSYVTRATDAGAAANDIRALIEARAETICQEGREMFDMGVTLRHSLEDLDGVLSQRVYLLPEDCQQF